MTVSETPHIRMFNSDCMEAMAGMEDNAYELAIVDPPYGIDAGNMTMGRGSGNDTGKHNLKDWDKNTPKAEYFSQLFRVSKNQVIWGGNYFGHFLGDCKGPAIWDKEDYNSDFSDGEMAWQSTGKNMKILRRSRSFNGAHLNKIHPTQKPVFLYKWTLKNYATEGDRILDTHGGSGSIAIACYDMGYDLDWYEIDSDYYNDAVERFNQHKAQGKLFEPKQEYNIEQSELNL